MGKVGAGRDFSQRVAQELIFENPGLTAHEVAALALERGSFESVANDQVGSLATSVHQRVRSGRLPGIERLGKGGRSDEFTFFPVDYQVRVRVTVDVEVTYPPTGRRLAGSWQGAGETLAAATQQAASHARRERTLHPFWLDAAFRSA